MTCFKCHLQSHKSFQCKKLKKDNKEDRKKSNPPISASMIPIYWNKIKSSNYIFKKVSNDNATTNMLG